MKLGIDAGNSFSHFGVSANQDRNMSGLYQVKAWSSINFQLTIWGLLSSLLGRYSGKSWPIINFHSQSSDRILLLSRAVYIKSQKCLLWRFWIVTFNRLKILFKAVSQPSRTLQFRHFDRKMCLIQRLFFIHRWPQFIALKFFKVKSAVLILCANFLGI